MGILSSETPTRFWRMLLFYSMLIAAGGGLFLLINSVGRHLAASGMEPINAKVVVASPATDALPHVLLALIVIILTTKVLGHLFRFVHQPPVIGEIIGGILLGPSLLGWVAPGVASFLLPIDAAPYLGLIAQMGVILFMFLVGLELDTTLLRQRAHAAIAISHASIIIPFVIGAFAALWLYPRYAAANIPFIQFALFLSISLSVTAFPVLARILTSQNLHRSPLGVLALTCASVDDATAWCLLAFIVGLVQTQTGAALQTIILSIAFITAMIFLLRPLVLRWVRRMESTDRMGQGSVMVVCVAILLSALATETIGIHALFGAFLLGAIIPHGSRVARQMAEKLEDIVSVLFLPAFFAFTGLRTQIGLLNEWGDWVVCGVIILLASVGKIGGSSIAARLTGLNWRDATSLGFLMNTRGLVELVVLNIGLDLGILSPRLFTILVLMALVTTLMTVPALRLLKKHDGPSAVATSD